MPSVRFRRRYPGSYDVLLDGQWIGTVRYNDWNGTWAAIRTMGWYGGGEKRTRREAAAALAEIVSADPGCNAIIWHGPGHQSKTRCHMRGEHKVHVAVFGEFRQYATWRGDEGMTGFFDEAPDAEGEDG